MSATADKALGAYKIGKATGHDTFPHRFALKALGMEYDAASKVWHTNDSDLYAAAFLAVTGVAPGQAAHAESQESAGGLGGGSESPHGQGGGAESEESEADEDPQATGDKPEDAKAPERPLKDAKDLTDREAITVLRALKESHGTPIGNTGTEPKASKIARIEAALPAGDRPAYIEAALNGAAAPGAGVPTEGKGEQPQAPGKPGQGEGQEGQGQADRAKAKQDAKEQAQEVFGPAGVAAVEAIANTADLDEDRVREIAREEDAVLLEAVSKAVEALAAEQSARTHAAPVEVARGEWTIKAPQNPTGVSSDGMHYLAPLVAALQVQGLNVALIGEPGTGKTHLNGDLPKLTGWGQAASVSCSAGMSEAPLTGRLLPLGNGRYLPSPFVSVYENGGHYLFDELDAAPADVLLVINSALANGGMVVEQRTVDPTLSAYITKHARVGILAGMNTHFGLSNTSQFTGRQPLDAATVDRFFPIRFDTDQRVVASMFGASAAIGAQPVWTPDKTPFTQAEADLWYAWYLSVESVLAKLSKKRVWSPRVGPKVRGARSAGMARKAVVASLFMGWTPGELEGLGALAQGPVFK